MLGEAFDAEEAYRIGLVTRVLPVGELEAFARKQAARLAALPASSLRETKRLMKGGDMAAVEARMAEEGRCSAACCSRPRRRKPSQPSSSAASRTSPASSEGRGSPFALPRCDVPFLPGRRARRASRSDQSFLNRSEPVGAGAGPAAVPAPLRPAAMAQLW